MWEGDQRKTKDETRWEQLREERLEKEKEGQRQVERGERWRETKRGRIWKDGPKEKGRRRGHEPNTTLKPRKNYHSLSFSLSSHP